MQAIGAAALSTDAVGASGNFEKVLNWAASRSSLLSRVSTVHEMQQHKAWVGSTRGNYSLATLASRPQKWTKHAIVSELQHIFCDMPVFCALLIAEIHVHLRKLVTATPEIAWFSRIPSKSARESFGACLLKLTDAEYALAFIVLHSSRASILAELFLECKQLAHLQAFHNSCVDLEQLDAVVQPALSPFVLDLAKQVLQLELKEVVRELLKSITELCEGQLPDWLLGATNSSELARQTKNFQLTSWMVLQFFTPSFQARVTQVRFDKEVRHELLSRFMQSRTYKAIAEPAFGEPAHDIHIEDLCMWERFVDFVLGEAVHPTVASGASFPMAGLRPDLPLSLVASWATQVHRSAVSDSHGSFSRFDTYRISNAAEARLDDVESCVDLVNSDNQSWLESCALTHADLRLVDLWEDKDFHVVQADWSGRKLGPAELGANKPCAWMVLREMDSVLVDDAAFCDASKTDVFSMTLVDISGPHGCNIARAVVGPDRRIYWPLSADWTAPLRFLGALQFAFSDEENEMKVAVLRVRCLCMQNESGHLVAQDCMHGGSAAGCAATPPALAGAGEPPLDDYSGRLVVTSGQIALEAEKLAESLSQTDDEPQLQKADDDDGDALSRSPGDSTDWIREAQLIVSSYEKSGSLDSVCSASVAPMLAAMGASYWTAELPSTSCQMSECHDRVVGGTPVCADDSEAAFSIRGTLGFIEQAPALATLERNKSGYLVGHTVAHVVKAAVDKAAFSDDIGDLSERIPAMPSVHICGTRFVPWVGNQCKKGQVLTAVVNHSGSDYCLLDASALHSKWCEEAQGTSGAAASEPVVKAQAIDGTSGAAASEPTTKDGAKLLFGCIHGLSDVLSFQRINDQTVLNCLLKRIGITDESARFSFRCAPVLLDAPRREPGFVPGKRIFVAKMGCKTGITIGTVRVIHQSLPGFSEKTYHLECRRKEFSSLPGRTFVVRAASLSELMSADIPGFKPADKLRLFLHSDNCRQAVQSCDPGSGGHGKFEEFRGDFALKGDSGAAVVSLDFRSPPCACGGSKCVLTVTDCRAAAVLTRKAVSGSAQGFVDLLTKTGRAADAAHEKLVQRLNREAKQLEELAVRPTLPVLGFISRVGVESGEAVTLAVPADAALLRSAGTLLATRSKS